MPYDYDEWEEAQEESRLRRGEKQWRREFDREHRRQFQWFMRPWDQADDEEAKRIVMGWAGDDPDAYALILAVLEQRSLKRAVELLDGDEITAEEVFDRTFQELQQKFKEEFAEPTGGAQATDGATAAKVSHEEPQGSGDRIGRKKKPRMEGPLYQGKNQFLALFRQRLEWRCADVWRRWERHPLVSGKATWGEILGWLTGEEDERIEDTIAAEAAALEEGVEEEERKRRENARYGRFLRSLSAALRETWEVMLRVVEEATGEIEKREIFRRTREILHIEPTTLTDRIHQIKLAYRKVWFGEPPDKKKPKRKSE